MKLKTFECFRKHPECNECRRKIAADSLRLTYEFVYNEFQNGGCKLLSKEYNNAHELLHYICKCGNEAYITYSDFKANGRCRECGNNKMRLPYDYVKDLFESLGFTLISKIYIDCDTPLECICICGKLANLSVTTIRAGNRCGCLKSKGEIAVKSVLDASDIHYKPQKRFDDCRNINTLPFDFYVDNSFLIEFAGEQHFKSIERFGGDAQLAKQIKHDDIKNRYAITNNIPILHISYKEMAHIPIIIDLYLAMIKANAAPPITFTNKKLYQRMYSSVKRLLKVPKIPKLLLTSNELPPDTESDYLFLPF